jgi:hypothetical protein
MNNTRTIVRRVIQMWALTSSIVAAATSGGLAQMFAEATPLVTKTIHYSRIPVTSEQLLTLVPYFKAIGIVSALVLTVASVLAFKLSKDENTRLQAVLVISVFGYGIAVWFWASVAVSLVLLPHAFNPI